LETEVSIDWTNNDEFNESAEKMHDAITSLQQAIKDLESQEPVAWMPESSAPKTGERFLALDIYDVVQEVEFSGLWYRDMPLWRNPHNHGNVNIKGWLPKASLHTHQATAHPPQRIEQNFCPRCGKRTNDIHTCTPPQD
jgi:hypothetical protein